MSITADLLNNTINKLAVFTEQIFTDSIGPIGEVLSLGLSFFLISMFMGMIYNKVDKNHFFALWWVCVLWFMVSNYSFYYEWLCQPFLKLTLNASCFAISSISDGNITTVTGLFTELDKVGEKLIDTLMSLTPESGLLSGIKASVHSFKVEMGLLLIALLYLASYAIFFAVFVSTIVMQFVLFMIGPLFILFFPFPQTRHLAWNWIKAQFTFSLTCVISAIFMGMNLWIFDQVTTTFSQIKVGDPIFGKEYMGMVALGALAIYLLLKAPSLSASLTGGQADNTSGLGMATMAVGGAAAAGAARFSPSAQTMKAGAAGAIKGLGAIQGAASAWRGSGNKPTR